MVDLRNVNLPQFISVCLSKWKESSTLVESCRREEIINAINRHRAKNVFSTQKDSGTLRFSIVTLRIANLFLSLQKKVRVFFRGLNKIMPEVTFQSYFFVFECGRCVSDVETMIVISTTWMIVVFECFKCATKMKSLTCLIDWNKKQDKVIQTSYNECESINEIHFRWGWSVWGLD